MVLIPENCKPMICAKKDYLDNYDKVNWKREETPAEALQKIPWSRFKGHADKDNNVNVVKLKDKHCPKCFSKVYEAVPVKKVEAYLTIYGCNQCDMCLSKDMLLDSDKVISYNIKWSAVKHCFMPKKILRAAKFCRSCFTGTLETISYHHIETASVIKVYGCPACGAVEGTVRSKVITEKLINSKVTTKTLQESKDEIFKIHC